MNDNLLIISNAALCQSDSNGRTVSRLLDCVPKEQKAQFYVYGCPDFREANTFYHISDSDALNSFIKRVKKNGIISADQIAENTSSGKPQKRKKTPLKMLIREFVWKYGCWRNKYLYKWVDEVNPSAILVVAGDNNFTLDFARKIAKKRNIPIILYSTEEYPFKNYNYVTKGRSLFYAIWHSKLRRAYKNIDRYIKAGIFNTDALAELYRKEYHYPCCAIYQSSDINWIENYKITEPIRVSYLGNLGLNRHKALIDIAKIIGEISPGATLDIYGNPIGQVKAELENCPYISLKGFVGYDEVVNVIHNSTLLVHAEFRDDFYTRDLKYAFSTKIADSVCSGTPFLIYAPNEIAETQFLREQGCAFVASDIEELKSQLKLALSDENARKEKSEKANIVRNRCFTNNGQFQNVLKAVLGENTSG